jgi:hypothetical protein
MAKRIDPKAKAKRQKILLGILGVVFLGIIAYQAPTILSLFGGSSTEASSTTTPPPPAPVPVGPSTPVAAPGAAPAPAAAAPTGSSGLIDSDPVVAPETGQLVSFDRFESKDPFAQQIGKPGSDSSAPPAPVPASPGGKAEDPDGFTQAPAPAPAPSAPPGAATTATISVNGTPHDVAAGGTFPSGEPIFKLVALTRTSAKIGIVGGGYSNGSATVTLRKGGKPVTLMNTADGTTYVLRLVGIG